MRTWWLFALLTVCAACIPIHQAPNSVNSPSSSTLVTTTRYYSVQQNLTLSNQGNEPPEKQNLWVALIRDVPPYQQVPATKISPNRFILVTDEYGNQYAEFDFSDHPAGTNINIEIDYEVAVHEITYELGDCQGELPDEFTQPELHIESANPQVATLANKLSNRKRTACEQVRAFYDFAGDELTYTYNRNDWGAQATLGLMGSDCTEYASLVIALSRAQDIPARYYEGLLYMENTHEDVANIEHAWLDVYLPGSGWVGIDPTLGRQPAMRNQYFAHYTSDHIIVTTGRHPSTLRGASYWSHLYWPGGGTTIRITQAEWTITPIEP